MKQLVCVFLCVVLTACASSSRRNIQMNYDESAPFDSYKTFTIEAIQQSHQASGLNSMIENGIIGALADKGLSHTLNEKGDLLIRYATRIEHSQEMRQEQISTGNGVYIKSQIEPVNEGSLLINIIDTNTDRIIWKASSISDITGVTIDNVTQARVDDAMDEVFEGYPSSMF
ncbi:DUF4136 domain-containing protein [Alkalimarinus alittae]|uniref:DUF4136 domain-containing protein n=1 Tax=Alkalimarinus alittae TaxID=2961619 RepID=A0ABY6N4I6_9ALTE|nr:DUF4136 domain-containing protein [Alkalimarinus alittae]UZE97006.1 DUF4136 domain-containing protein [Alkalimarinus alittae]